MLLSQDEVEVLNRDHAPKGMTVKDLRRKLDRFLDEEIVDVDLLNYADDDEIVLKVIGTTDQGVTTDFPLHIFSVDYVGEDR